MTAVAAGTDEKNGLGECLLRHLQITLPKELATSDWGNPNLTPEQLTYARDDVFHLHLLKEKLETALEKEGLTKVADLEMSLLPVIVAIEAQGIAVDRAKLAEIHEAANRQAQTLKAEMQPGEGQPEFNPSSPKQVLARFAAAGIQLKNTTRDTLVECKHPLASTLLNYREAEKHGQQAKTLLEAAAENGRIHTSFNPLGTVTGRFSSSAPNLQNVGRGELRSCFIPAPGCAFITADYSQIELRAAAAIAKEQKMLNAYKEGADLHKQTASLVLNKPVDEVSKDDRQLAKAVNFGLLYGQTSKGLVGYVKSGCGVELTEAQATDFRNRFFRAYAGLKRWHAENWRKAKQGAKEVRMVTGRRQLLPSGVDNEWQRFTGLVNTTVQGGCADGLKYAMVELARQLPEGAHIVSTVHDELIVEVPQALAEQVKDLVRKCMIDEMARLFPDVPIEVDAKVAANWGEK